MPARDQLGRPPATCAARDSGSRPVVGSSSSSSSGSPWIASATSSRRCSPPGELLDADVGALRRGRAGRGRRRTSPRRLPSAAHRSAVSRDGQLAGEAAALEHDPDPRPHRARARAAGRGRAPVTRAADRARGGLRGSRASWSCRHRWRRAARTPRRARRVKTTPSNGHVRRRSVQSQLFDFDHHACPAASPSAARAAVVANRHRIVCRCHDLPGERQTTAVDSACDGTRTESPACA